MNARGMVWKHRNVLEHAHIHGEIDTMDSTCRTTGTPARVCRELEAKGLMKRTSKYGYSITDAGREFVVMGPARSMA